MTRNKEIFRTEITRRFKNSDLTIASDKNGKDFVISNSKGSSELIVRTEFQCTDPDDLMHLREPAPFYNAQAVLFFRFSFNDSVHPPDFIVFICENPILKRTDFLIFKAAVLKGFLAKVQIKPDKSGYNKLLLWIFRNDFVFVANNISGEGEWYLLGGLDNDIGSSDCMAKGSERDLSGYLNQWNAFDEFEALKK
jgi:hypothetical protein